MIQFIFLMKAVLQGFCNAQQYKRGDNNLPAP